MEKASRYVTSRFTDAEVLAIDRWAAKHNLTRSAAVRALIRTLLKRANELS